jgi:hypothetical protein
MAKLLMAAKVAMAVNLRERCMQELLRVEITIDLIVTPKQRKFFSPLSSNHAA